MTAAVLRMTRLPALADVGEPRWEKAMKEFVDRPDDPVNPGVLDRIARFAAVPPGDR